MNLDELIYELLELRLKVGGRVLVSGGPVVVVAVGTAAELPGGVP